VRAPGVLGFVVLFLAKLTAPPAGAQVPPARAAIDPAAAPEEDKDAVESPAEAAAVLDRFRPPPVPPAPTGPPAERMKWLQAQLDQALAESALGKAKIGIAVADVETGKLVYQKNDAALFNPASNVKLFTTAAALALLGPEYRWRTVVHSDGSVHNGELRGKMYLKGQGDPTLVVEDLWRLASELWGMGIRKVSGDLVVDDTFFDGVRVGPGFEQKAEDLYYRAPAGALSVNYNAVRVRVLPGVADGEPARVLIDPQTPYFTIVNEARTATTGRTAVTIEAKEDAEHTILTVTGRIRKGNPGRVALKRIAHPDLHAAHAFREMCLRRGIKWSGNLVRGETPAGARILTAHASQPLGIAVRDVNKQSNNFMAEQILKTLGAETGGRPGTWQKGIDAVASFLERIGIAKSAYKMTNGSGMYDANRFSPAQMVTLLRAAAKDFRFAADFIASLALAAADGTILHRMEGGFAERHIRAKTGTLAGVSCLAGYAGAPGKAPLAFAILMNDLPESATPLARRAQDLVAEALVSYLLAP
jgi:D-alanyl-D-alanine carboxypeptidase/D-alanyl-D-alanine-endopeptidase (penicillin-binding protein 4)